MQPKPAIIASGRPCLFHLGLRSNRISSITSGVLPARRDDGDRLAGRRMGLSEKSRAGESKRNHHRYRGGTKGSNLASSSGESSTNHTLRREPWICVPET